MKQLGCTFGDLAADDNVARLHVSDRNLEGMCAQVIAPRGQG